MSVNYCRAVGVYIKLLQLFLFSFFSSSMILSQLWTENFFFKNTTISTESVERSWKMYISKSGTWWIICQPQEFTCKLQVIGIRIMGWSSTSVVFTTKIQRVLFYWKHFAKISKIFFVSFQIVELSWSNMRLQDSYEVWFFFSLEKFG